ncbi:MAG: hypothetical protein HY719_12430 [Planctomycetes bacterium]|nr:hypothetical protein [Planctomycetota bacterium]
MARRRIILVSHLFGSDLPSDSARAAARFARLIARRHDVTVFTTTAVEETLWSGELPVGAAVVEGVAARRFPLDFRRQNAERGETEPPVSAGRLDARAEERWWRLRGPFSTALFTRVARESATAAVDLVLCWDARFATARFGIEAAGARAALFAVAAETVPAHLAGFTELVRRVPLRLCAAPWDAPWLASRFSGAPFIPCGLLPIATARATGAGGQGRAASSSDSLAAGGKPGPGEGDGAPHEIVVLADGGLDLRAGGILHALARWRAEPGRPAARLRFAGRSATQAASALDAVMRGEAAVSTRVDSAALAGAALAVSLGGRRLQPDAEIAALSAGAPIVVPEEDRALVGLARDSNAGLWFATRDELAACIERLLDDGALHALLSRRARVYGGACANEEAYLDGVERAMAEKDRGNAAP